jgi:nitrate/TMAO reductase-like tetraheme cytochrome c subunit
MARMRQMDPRRWLAASAMTACGVALYALWGSAPLPDGRAEVELASRASRCRECHAEVYAEWSRSWHARSWTEPEVRRQSNDFANVECLACHAPRPVFETGLEQRVVAREASFADGVDCIACHAVSEAVGARVVGTAEHPDAPCRPIAMPELSSTAFCAPCHNQHQTVTEWMTSRYAAEGIGCIDCHMPHRGGDPSRGRDHTMHGGHSLELLQAAVELRARRTPDGVVVEVENVGAGHSFPTDERSRAADVFWRPASGGPWRFLHRFRSPYRDEIGVEQTVLAAHATARIPLEDPEAAGPLEVALFYKLTPYWGDPARPDPEREATLVERVALE